MAEFVKVAKTADIAEGQVRAVHAGGFDLALFNLGGSFHALEDLCTHEDAPLSEGWVEGTEVECPWHAARFEITSGKALCEPACGDVRSFATRVVGDDLEVEV